MYRAIRAYLGYSILDLRKAIRAGNLEQTEYWLNYFKNQGRLHKVLHTLRDCWDVTLMPSPRGAWAGIPLLDAFRNPAYQAPQYPVIILLLNAGTDPSFNDVTETNILHYALQRNDLTLFRLFLHFVKDFAAIHSIKHRGIITLRERINTYWETARPGVTVKIDQTIKDFKQIRALLEEARSASFDVSIDLTIKAAELYIDQANLDGRPDYGACLATYDFYLSQAYNIYHELNEKWDQALPTSINLHKHMAVLEVLTRLAEHLSKPDEAKIYQAQLSMLRLEAARPPFFSAVVLSNSLAASMPLSSH